MGDLWVLVGALAFVYLLGLLALPITVRAFSGYPILGWGLSKLAGILLVGWVTWLLVSVSGHPFERPIILVGALIVGTAAWLGAVRRLPSLRQAIRDANAGRQELLFLGAFLAFALLRGFNPDIYGGEKLSDAMYLGALLNDRALPPADLWFAGHRVNYYYFGYYLLTMVAKAVGAPLGLTYNYSLCLLFALAAAGLAALLRVALGRDRMVSRWIAAGLALEFVLGNLAPGLRLLSQPGTVLADVWGQIGYGATRVLTFSDIPTPGGAISEFPSFSFLFGDLHPHLIALPFSFLYLAGAYVACAGRTLTWSFWALMAVTVGAFGAMNSWELPVAGLVLAIATLLGGLQSERPLRAVAGRLAGMMAVALVALAAFMPFYRHFEPPRGAQGAMLVLTSRITLESWLTHFGVFAFLWASWLVLGWRRCREIWLAEPRWARMGLVVLGFLALVAGGVLRSPLLSLLVVSLVLSAWGALREHTESRRFALAALALAFALVLLADLVSIHDHSNTIFKLYMPAWTLFAIGSGVLLPEVWSMLAPNRWERRAWVGLATVVGLLAAVFPTLAAASWNHAYSAWRGLDGLAFLASQSPSEMRALVWLQTRPPGSLLEMSGPSWSDANRLAVLSGRGTWLGWVGHERLWHEGAPRAAEVDHRFALLSAALEKGDASALQETLVASGARFVVVTTMDADVKSRLTQALGAEFRLGFEDGSLRIFERQVPLGAPVREPR